LTHPFFAPRTWARARAALEAPEVPLLVVLDLDGTIAPIARRPDLARVPASTLRWIGRAVRGSKTRIAILSARPGPDLARLVPVRGVVRIGQYGLDGPLAPPARVRAQLRRRCARVAAALRPLVRAVPGALLEAKGLTVAVHSRGVKSEEKRRLLTAGLLSVASGEARRQGFTSVPGSLVVDFVPRGHDKGRALRTLRARLTPRAIFYFGDSDGDEPAFSALTKRDFPVRVGREKTRARYRVMGIGGVARFLEAVAASRAGTT